MKRFLGILIALLLVFSGVVFAQQQSTKTLDDIDARIAALGTFSWSGWMEFDMTIFPRFIVTGLKADASDFTYGNLWFQYCGALYGSFGLTVKWSGVTLSNTFYFDPDSLGLTSYNLFPTNMDVGYLYLVQKLTFAKDNISLWFELITDYDDPAANMNNKYELYDVGFTISKIFDIISLRVGGFGRVYIREYSPLYPNRLFANGTGDFRDRGLNDSGISATGASSFYRVAMTISLMDNALNIYLWNKIYYNTTNIAEYLGNAQNTTLGIKYTLQDIGIIRFNIQQGFAINRENTYYAANYFYTGSAAGNYVAKFAPINKYFVEFRLVAVENLDLLVTAQLDIATRINRNPAAITGTGAVNDPFVLQYKNTMKIDAGIDALYVLGETMDIGIHLGFNTISGMNYLELEGGNWTTPTVGGSIYYVSSNYTEANYIQKNYAGDLFNAGLYFNYYLDKYTLSIKLTYSHLNGGLTNWDLDGNGTVDYQWYLYYSKITPGLNFEYAVSANSSITLALTYIIYLGLPAYNSNLVPAAITSKENYFKTIVQQKFPTLSIDISYYVTF